MKNAILLIFIFSSSVLIEVSAQIYSHNFGTTAISSHPYNIAPGTFDSNLSNSSWSNTTNSWTSFAGSSGQALALNNSVGTPVITLTFNVNPGCLLDITSFNFWRQRSTTGAQNWSMTINGVNVGAGTVPTTGAAIGNTVVTGMTGLTGTVNVVLSLSGASGTGTFRFDDFTLNGSTSCAPTSNTITTGAITGAPFSVDCSTPDSGSIDFTSTGTFNASNSYTAQLSDASGNFASPTNIGSLNSTANTGSIPITIPSGTASGAGYLIRIVSSDPAITGSNSGSFTVTLSGGPCTLTPPYMTSLIYDGCNVTCSGSSTEGRSEIIFGNTGDYSVAVNPTNVRFIYNTNGNQPLTSGIVNNAATTANLNTEAGCPGLFLDGFGQTLSPNTSFLVVSENLCISSLIWSDLCGSGPIYVLYASSSPTTWNDGGNFGNTAGTRNLQTIITATDGSVHDISYSYTSVNGGDGSYATWTSAGGTPATSGIFSNCRLTPVALPTGITFFKATFYEPNNQLFWQSHSEQNNDFYTLQHSTDGLNYYEIGITQGAGNSSSLINYSFSHNRPPRGINYYKLTSTDYDGTTYYKGITAVMVEGEGTYFDPYTSQLKFGERSDYSIYSTDGKLLGTENNTDSMEFQHHGMILIQDLKTLSIERLFIP